jgi:tetratricopeptide (TPR) repeat protein
VSLFLLGERYSWWRGNPAVTAGALVYLAPVKNETGEKSLDNITALLQASLEQSAHINLLDQGRVGDILQNMTKPADTPITQPIGREIALRANAARVIFSSVTGSQGHYTLNIDIQRPVRFRDHWPNSFPWQVTGNTNSASQSTTIPQQLTSTLRNATDWIRKEVGESNNDIARTDDPPEDATTGSWEALQEFNEAIQLQHELKTEEAIQHLKQAVGIDPNFALAYGRLGDLEFSVGSSSAGLRSYARALDLTEIERLTARERDRIRGLAASDSGDFQSAVEAFRDYTVNYPQDYLGWFYLGNSVMMLGRKDEGIADMRNSYNRDPSSLSPAIQLGVFDAATGDFEGASELASKLRTNGASGYSAYLSGFSSFLEGKYDDAESNFAQIKNGSSPPGRTNGVLILEHLTAEQGRYAEALQLLDQGIVEDKQKGREADKSAKLIDRASIHAKLGNYARMLEDIDAALQADTNSLRIQSAGSILSLSLQAAPPSITVAIRERLRRLDREYSGDELGNYSKIAKFRIHAQALMASGDWESALIEARKASALDAPTADRSYLASILLSAANHQAEPAKKQALVNEAFHAYSAIVLSPGLAWDDWYRNPPGFLADEMTTFLDIASWLNIQDDDTQNVRNTLGLLRPGYAKSASQARRNSNLANTIQ